MTVSVELCQLSVFISIKKDLGHGIITGITMFKRNKQQTSQTEQVEEDDNNYYYSNNEMDPPEPPSPPPHYSDQQQQHQHNMVETLPRSSHQPDTIAITNSNVNENIEIAQLAMTSSPTTEELDSKLAAQQSKSYFAFGSCMTALGFLFSIVSAFSCSFGVVNWAVDGNAAAYQSSISHIGLFRWYNPVTSSCWAYSADDTEFFFVDGAARGLSGAAVVLGGCATFMDLIILMANLGSCARKESCSRFNLNSSTSSLSKTFFGLAGVTFVSSILQISTMSYFSQGNQTQYAITCNASLDSNCSMGVGAHYAIISFIMYLLAGFVYAMAGVGCRAAGEPAAKSGGGGYYDDGEMDEDNLPPPPPPPPLPSTPEQQKQQGQQQYEEEDLGSLDTDSAGSGSPPPPPSARFARFDDSKDELESV